MFQRALQPTLIKAVKSFPAVWLTGPRQSGKTTLLKSTFPDYHYLNLETPDTLNRLQEDPKGFLQSYPHRFIIDEAQRYPEFFSYLQEHIDNQETQGQIILSGSQNFMLSDPISQTLAGRIAILNLLPLSYSELITQKDYANLPLWELLYRGSYPRPYQESLDIDLWFNAYIQTYLERDVRTLIGIKDLMKFQLFLKLCAGHHGQLLNMSAIANDCGVSQPTIHHWISLLEATYIVHRLPPFYKNFNKRLVKTAKLYFYDSALVCHLLGINSSEHLSIHSSRGAIFEGFILTEIIKQFYKQGKKAPVYFWRDQQGNELDIIIEKGNELEAIEIKSSSTYHVNFLKALKKWQTTSNHSATQQTLVYTGKENFLQGTIHVTPWKSFCTLYA